MNRPASPFMRSSKLSVRHIGWSGILYLCVRLGICACVIGCGRGVVCGGMVCLGWGYVRRERATEERQDKTTGMVQTPKSSSVKSQPLPGLQRPLHLCCNASSSLRQTAIRASPLGDDPFLTGSSASRTPVSLRVADGQSQSPRSVMSFPHPLASAPCRLPRPFTLHSSRAASPSPTYRTVCCAVLDGNPGKSTWVHAVSAPPPVISRIFHPTAIPSSRSCLVLSRLI